MGTSNENLATRHLILLGVMSKQHIHTSLFGRMKGKSLVCTVIISETTGLSVQHSNRNFLRVFWACVLRKSLQKFWKCWKYHFVWTYFCLEDVNSQLQEFQGKRFCFSGDVGTLLSKIVFTVFIIGSVEGRNNLHQRISKTHQQFLSTCSFSKSVHDKNVSFQVLRNSICWPVFPETSAQHRRWTQKRRWCPIIWIKSLKSIIYCRYILGFFTLIPISTLNKALQVRYLTNGK